MSESQNVCQNDLQIDGSDEVDYRITVDYSESFYRPELVLITDVNSGEEVVKIPASSVQFNRKMNSEYFFYDIQPGKYHVMLRQNFKEGHCVSPVTLTLGAHKTSANENDLTSGTGFGG